MFFAGIQEMVGFAINRTLGNALIYYGNFHFSRRQSVLEKY